jgi:hypothetical protein
MRAIHIALQITIVVIKLNYVSRYGVYLRIPGELAYELAYKS